MPGFSFFRRRMEPTITPVRPPALTRLCIISFIDQGVFILLYLLCIPAAAVMRDMEPEALNAMVRTVYGPLLQGDQLDTLQPYIDLLRAHGVVLMIVFALRTLARLIGTWRMWNLKNDGLHIYISAQLLGLLLPMLIAGAKLFAPVSLVVILGWCFLYWTHRKALVA